jgi:hypothetical protein
VRQANERLILNTIRQNPLLSRTDIVRLTGLSPSAVTCIVGRLSRNRLISEEEVESQSRVGRRPMALRLRPESKMAVGVQILRPASRVALADFNGNIARSKIVRWHPNRQLEEIAYYGALGRVRPRKIRFCLAIALVLSRFFTCFDNGTAGVAPSAPHAVLQ